MNPDDITPSIEETSDQFPLLGYTVSVNLHGVEVDHATLLTLLTPLGFGHFLPPVREPATTLRRALARWIKDQAAEEEALGSGTFEEEDGEEEQKIKKLIREVASTRKSDVLTMALVLEGHFLSKLGLTYLTDLRVFFDKKTDEILLTTSPKGSMETARARMSQKDRDLLTSFFPYWQKYRDVHISGDLFRMVKDIYATIGATAMRKGGGVYFLPYVKRAELTRFKHLIESLPAADGTHPATVLHLPVVDTKTSKKQLAKIAHDAFVAEITALQKELDTITKRAEEKVAAGKATRIHTNNVLLHLEKYKGVKAKAALYQEALGMRQSQVISMLDQLQQQGRRLLEMATSDDEETPTETAHEEEQEAEDTATAPV